MLAVGSSAYDRLVGRKFLELAIPHFRNRRPHNPALVNRVRVRRLLVREFGVLRG
jgi:hypothetical protein